MKKIKVFLASSNELKAERDQFEIGINRKNKEWFDKDVYIHLDIWEDLSARMSSGGSQSEYNKFVKSADLFVLLAFTKVGKYTEEEFENAFKAFQSANKPFIFTYFKNTTEPVDDSLNLFKNKLSEMGHFFSPFADSNDLWLQINKELDRLDLSKFGENKNKGFNEILTRRLMYAINKFNGGDKGFLQKANQVATDWETQPNISDVAKEIVSFSFVGILGIQLRKLLAIGKEDPSDAKQQRYIDNCLITAKRALQLLCFSLISKLWDQRKESEFELTSGQTEELTKFFEGFEQNIEDYMNLLVNLYDIYVNQNLEFPLADKLTFDDLASKEGDFRKACSELHIINRLLNENNFTLLTCFEAEKQLTIVLEKLIFFVNYKMISMKDVTFARMRNNVPNYLHKYAALGIDSKNNINAEKVNYVGEPVNTDAILLFTGKYQESLNLFPFIIDVNALTFEDGSKICFYSYKDIQDGSLNYRFLEDNSIKNITFKDILKADTNINELMMDKEKRKQLKLDAVSLQFEDAKETILGKKNDEWNAANFT